MLARWAVAVLDIMGILVRLGILPILGTKDTQDLGQQGRQLPYWL